ncbi:Abi family protein [Corynebacterium auriscanis]|uniref:Abi family protein n=1 Tax=Corynebacterium auriscanis TaxID=99807 RepID=UPI0022481B96|nr:Abi family protein [Corynebacterium auriscanis]MCX2164045.1 Abi family protein [Corynebacterium auriscanis]
MKKIKNPTTVDEQITLLRTRGMEVNEPLARQWLSSVSYYRLSGYWYSYRVLPEPEDPKEPQRADSFVPGTTFEEVVALYEFDRKMRTLIYDGIERIEVALRARIGELLIAKGALSYKDRSCFREKFQHQDWLKTAEKRVDRARKRSQAVAHYAANYDDYPFWVLADALDFSDISILFDGLLLEDQRSISHSFGLRLDPDQLNSRQRKSYYNQDPLARWCEQLTVLRNTCAHHSRLWNRYFTPASTNAIRTIQELSCLPKGQSERLFGALTIIAFMLRSVSPGSTWVNKVRKLIEEEYDPLALRKIDEMGFPDDWRNLPVWTLH